MGLEEEVRGLRMSMEAAIQTNETLEAEIDKLATVAETLKGHQVFLQGLVQQSFKHQQKQDSEVQSALIKWLGWVIAGAVAVGFGLKLTGVV